MSEIAIRNDELEPLTDYATIIEQIHALVENEASEELEEARRRSEAFALYETRRKNAERARYYWTLKILTEAGLGCLAFEHPEVIPSSNLRNDCRVLASAFERDHLLKLIDSEFTPDFRSHNRGGSWKIVNVVRASGYTYAPGKSLGKQGSVPWREARLIAREIGKPLTSIPPDPAYVRRQRDNSHALARRNHRQAEAFKRLQRMKREKLVAAAAQEFGPRFDVAYGYLRQALQALHDAQGEMTREQRQEADDLFWYLHRLEDMIAKFLRVGETP